MCATGNIGTAGVSLNGWRLRDAAGRFWNLGGTLDAGDEMLVLRNGQAMALNNGGDTVDLLHSSGAVVQTVTYGLAQEDVPIMVAETL